MSTEIHPFGECGHVQCLTYWQTHALIEANLRERYLHLPVDTEEERHELIDAWKDSIRKATEGR